MKARQAKVWECSQCGRFYGLGSGGKSRAEACCMCCVCKTVPALRDPNVVMCLGCKVTFDLNQANDAVALAELNVARTEACDRDCIGEYYSDGEHRSDCAASKCGEGK